MCCFANKISVFFLPFICNVPTFCISTNIRKTILTIVIADSFGSQCKSNYCGIAISDLCCHFNYMVYSTLLIGFRCFVSAHSKLSSDWLVEIKVMILLICLYFQSPGVPHWLNYLTELIIPPPEPAKLVQSKAWLVESVVLNRIKAAVSAALRSSFFPPSAY